MYYFLINEPKNYSKEAIKIYRSVGKVYYKKTPFIKKKISVLVVRLKFLMSQKVIENYPNLKYIISPTTGVNHIDQKICKKRKIKVIYFRDSSPNFLQNIKSTAELTIGLIIALVRRIPHACQDVVKKNIWDRDLYQSRELSCLTLGIIGLGRIGSHMAEIGSKIFSSVIACDPFQDKNKFSKMKITKVKLKTLLKKSDVICLHARESAKRKPLLGKHQLQQMKKGSYLINTARGELLCEKSVFNLLRRGQISGLATDVLVNETRPEYRKKSKIIQAAKAGYNVIITPHLGGSTIDAMRKAEIEMAKIIKQKFSKPRSLV